MKVLGALAALIFNTCLVIIVSGKSIISGLNLRAGQSNFKYSFVITEPLEAVQIPEPNAFLEANNIQRKQVPVMTGLIHMRGMGFIWVSGNSNVRVNSADSYYDALYEKMPYWVDPQFHPYFNTTEIHCHRFVIWTDERSSYARAIPCEYPTDINVVLCEYNVTDEITDEELKDYEDAKDDYSADQEFSDNESTDRETSGDESTDQETSDDESTDQETSDDESSDQQSSDESTDQDMIVGLESSGDEEITDQESSDVQNSTTQVSSTPKNVTIQLFMPNVNASEQENTVDEIPTNPESSGNQMPTTQMSRKSTNQKSSHSQPDKTRTTLKMK